ncbi:CYTH domain-containing protein [Mucilaginibacter aquaedulcis]|uniref:CYTH domain-containing protein n=1 Tax=Mucilaginibacter aquaedulcis TaxID=1187081 RepID=UPI0025B4D5B5|nr:CYTH domain-containing protein [Mucilaginibacter aquaedulcis]MDN3547101.1 CYTH domain-containing protein [Mucilaginibacter aquaedulcis]
MAVEIERKFLVDHEKWRQLIKPDGKHYRQGYIFSDATKTIRVRVTPEHGYITIKGASKGISRKEYEYTIPAQEGVELLDNFAVSELEKVRYNITFEGKLWEVDEFLGENKGLLMAEIELEHEAETFKLPDWITTEVTDDKRYYNSFLSVNPYSRWGKTGE